MRKSTSKACIAYEESETGPDRVWGVFLGYDFCSEHEHGIRRLLSAFGIPAGDEMGVARRKASVVPKGLSWVGKGSRKGILMATPFDVEYEKDNVAAHYWQVLRLDEARHGLVAAWDEESFMVTSNVASEADALQEVFKHFKEMDAIVCLHTDFMGSSLLLGIASRIPANIGKEWEKNDLDRNQAQKKLRESGIEKLLAKKGKRYFSLSPQIRSDGELSFWLNPMEQQKNNFGWFALQDLKDWAKDKGPIPKKKKREDACTLPCS